MDYMLYDVVINSVRVLGGGVDKGQTPKEAITLKYNRIVWTYAPYDEKLEARELRFRPNGRGANPWRDRKPPPTPV